MSTETPDLACRLLAKIEEIERADIDTLIERQTCWELVGDDSGLVIATCLNCNGSFTGLEDAIAPQVEAHVAECQQTPVLQLCQAHRQIIDMYQVAKAQPVSRDKGKLRGLDHASAMGRLTTLGLVVQALAVGYGIQEDS